MTEPMTSWWQHATIYHIYPLSFADADGDGWGDLPGITAHLDHPAELGADAIWLSPVYRSPMVDFGYDITDHCDVDPRFGTLADAEELIAAAHRRGLRVLLDYVPNHTSDQHPWFLDAVSGRAAAHREYYIWADPAADGGPPNNWRSAFAAVGSAWTYDRPSAQYYLHSYTPQQPDLNWRSPAVRQAMHDVLRFWLERGVDGFRVDAPHRLAKDAALRDNPSDVVDLLLSTQVDDRRHRNIDVDDAHEIVRGIRAVLDGYPGTVLIGEVGVRHPQRRLAYHGADDELQLLFDFGFLDCPWSAAAFRAAGERLDAEPDPARWPTHVLSSHDISRHATRFGSTNARAAAVLLLTLPGTAVVYYGEELGMTDVAIPPERAADPDGRDPERTPMPWDASPGGGFTRGTPWLPIDPSGPDVASQRDDPRSLLSFYRTLLTLRRGDPRWAGGRYATVPSGEDVYAYTRERDGRTVLVAINFTDRVLDARLAAGSATVVVSSAERTGVVELGALRLLPAEAVVVEVDTG